MLSITSIHVSARAARRALLRQLGLLAAPAHGIVPWSRELSGRDGAATAIRRLQAVQVDPVAAVERNHHLVLMNRVKRYRPQHLDALFARGEVFEHLANARCVLPSDVFPRFWPIMRQLARNGAAARRELSESIREIIRQIKAAGLVQARQVGNEGPRLLGLGYNAPDEASKASGHALDLLWLGGDIVVLRQGGTKYYRLTEHVLPQRVIAALQPPLRREADGLVAMPDEASAGYERPWSAPVVSRELAPWSGWLLDMYANAYHIFEAGDVRLGWQRHAAAQRQALLAEKVQRGELVRLTIAGVRRPYFATPAAAALACWEDDSDVAPDVRFLPALDNLLWRRERLADLFGFPYTWEIYYPAHKRRYGYYAMPILYGDRLIGRLDPRLEREQGRLTLELLQIEPGVRLRARDIGRLRKALDRFARFHGATTWHVKRSDPAELMDLLATGGPA